MGDLQFNIYFCWMSEETFSEQIMIYKPISTITRCFTEAALQQFEIATVGELIDYLKDDSNNTLSLIKQQVTILKKNVIIFQEADWKERFRIINNSDLCINNMKHQGWNSLTLLSAAHLFTMRPAIDLPFIPTKKFMNICRMFMFQKQEWRYVILWSLCCQWILL